MKYFDKATLLPSSAHAEQKLDDELGRWSWKWNGPITLILQGPEC